MPRFFTHYWSNDTWQESRESGDRTPLQHSAGSQFRDRGVKAGDFVYVVTNLDGRLMLGGRMRVTRICDRKEAKRVLGIEPWNAPDQVLGSDGTALCYDRPVPQEVVRKLRFGLDAQPLRFRGNKLDQQTLRGVRELSKDSARMLDGLLQAASTQGLQFVETAQDVAASMQTFRTDLEDHLPLAQSIARTTRYWVHDPDSGSFGPGKFVGYRGMRFQLYQSARAGELPGCKFDGHASRLAIEQALGASFAIHRDLTKDLSTWLDHRIPRGSHGINRDRWRFVTLAGSHLDRLPEEVPTVHQHIEGAVRQITVNAYERDPEARRRCIARHGTRCCVCNVDLVEIYGELARGFVHIHHLDPISKAGGSRVVDPIRDLRPVCPNCHAMLHREDPPMRIEALRSRLRASRSQP